MTAPFLWLSPPMRQIVTIRVNGRFLRSLGYALILLVLLAFLLFAMDSCVNSCSRDVNVWEEATK